MKRGTDATLSLHLPRLLSAWGADAFHPMIRLGYGVRFDLPAEISAGLAYLTIKGPNQALERVAVKDRPGIYSTGILYGYLAAGAPDTESDGRFEPQEFGFEQDVKLVFTLDEMARWTGSERYREAADVFIRKLPKVDVGLQELEDSLNQ